MATRPCGVFCFLCRLRRHVLADLSPRSSLLVASVASLPRSSSVQTGVGHPT